MAKKHTPRFERPRGTSEVDKAYHKAVKQPKKKQTAAVVVIILLVVLIIGIMASFLLSLSDNLEDGIIMDNVRIAGIDVGGMTVDEAINAVRLTLTDSYQENPMVVIISGQEVILPAELTNVQLDVEAAVNAAYALGRTGSRAEKKEQQLLAASSGIEADIQSCLTVNTEAILNKLAEENVVPAGQVVQTTYELTGEAPDLASEELTDENAQTLLIHKGIPGFDFNENDLIKEIRQAFAANTFLVEFNCQTTDPDTFDLDALHEELTVEVLNAEMDPETFEVTPHSYGYGFSVQDAKSAYEAADFGADIEIPLLLTAPEQTTEALSSVLFRDTLASHSAYYYSNSYRATNLRLACEALDGTIVMPGQTLSYNNTLGERTEEKGYLPAASYVGGKTENTLGGGICQPSSVLYYCVLLADLEVVERYCHQFFCTYMDPGMDATIFWNGPDFKFRNNTEYPVRIDAEANGGTVSVALVGTDTKDYYIDMEYEWLATYNWETVYEEFTQDDNPKGYKNDEVITSPYTGYKYNTYKCKYSKADDSLIERTFEAVSVYDSRDKVIAKDVTKPEATEPPATEAPETQPPATEPPATEAPETQPPVATDPPVTETQPPATDAPAEDNPSAES